MDPQAPRVVSPPPAALDSLRQPLTRGERLVLEYFLATLPPGWEIYIQPHLNGLRPDFVLLHPRRGIAVFEVKDWDLDAVEYFVELGHAGAPPLLMGRKDGKVFSRESDNPVRKISLYKEEIYSLYCPHLPAGAGLGCIVAGVIFPFATTARALALLDRLRTHYKHADHPRQYPVAGSDALADGSERSLKHNFLSSVHHLDPRMSSQVADDLRHWLVEPDASAEQRRPLLSDLTARQRELVTTRTVTGYRRIRGAAGSGKTLVLAGRAAQLAAEGHKVLVVTFNITLINYILDLAVRFSRSGKTRDSITALNFHLWCKRLADQTGHLADYEALWKSESQRAILESVLPEMACEWVAEIPQEDLFDAVFVDEAQDFRQSWWLALRGVLKPQGEALMCADRVQNIYGVTPWTEQEMSGAGFRGEWVTLRDSFRLPRELCELCARFVDQFLPDVENLRPASDNLELPFNRQLKWWQVPPNDSAHWCVEALLSTVASSKPPIAFADLTCIVADEATGRQVVRLLGERKIRCIHTFGDSEDKEDSHSDSRRRKFAFFKGDARVKVTTLHSFKGWESKALVVHIHRARTPDDLALAYVSLTRLKRDDSGCYLTVVCEASELESYGRAWPHFDKKARRDEPEGQGY